MMNYNDFEAEVFAKVRERFSEDYEIEFVEMQKAGGLRKGLRIRAPKTDTAPVFYLEDFYEGLGTDFADTDEVADAIMFKYAASMENAPTFPDDMTELRQCLSFRLIDRELRADYIKNALHRPFVGNIDILPMISFKDEKNDGIFAALVTADLAEQIGCTEDEVFRIAMETAQKEIAPKLVEAFENDNILETVGRSKHSMCVLQAGEQFGARAMAYDDILELCWERLGDFYILPSSVHEVLCIPMEHIPTPKDALEMVKAANDSPVVSDDDLLTYDVFTYTEDGLKVIKAA